MSQKDLFRTAKHKHLRTIRFHDCEGAEACFSDCWESVHRLLHDRASIAVEANCVVIRAADADDLNHAALFIEGWRLCWVRYGRLGAENGTCVHGISPEYCPECG